MQALFEKLLDEISRPQAEIDALREAISEADDEQKARVIVAKLPLLIDPQNHPEWIELWRQIWSVWGKPSPFAYVPLREVLIVNVYVGSLVYPNLNLKKATNQIVRDIINIHKNHFFIRTFLKANGRNWEYFLQTFTTWRKLYASFKGQDEKRDLWIEKISSQEIHIYERVPFANVVSYVVQGVFEGFMDLFEISGKTSSLLLDPHFIRIQIQWENSSP